MRTPKSGKPTRMFFGNRAWGRTMTFLPKHGNPHTASVPSLSDEMGLGNGSGIDWYFIMSSCVKVNNRSWNSGTEEIPFMD